MYHDRTPLARGRLLLRVLLALVLAAALALGCAWSLGRVGADLDGQGAAALRNAVLRSAVQCYAVEGYYPQDLDYLTDHYGLQINHDRYIVTYDVFATNQLPDVQVLQKE